MLHHDAISCGPRHSGPLGGQPVDCIGCSGRATLRTPGGCQADRTSEARKPARSPVPRVLAVRPDGGKGTSRQAALHSTLGAQAPRKCMVASAAPPCPAVRLGRRSAPRKRPPASASTSRAWRACESAPSAVRAWPWLYLSRSLQRCRATCNRCFPPSLRRAGRAGRPSRAEPLIRRRQACPRSENLYASRLAWTDTIRLVFRSSCSWLRDRLSTKFRTDSQAGRLLGFHRVQCGGDASHFNELATNRIRSRLGGVADDLATKTVDDRRPRSRAPGWRGTNAKRPNDLHFATAFFALRSAILRASGRKSQARRRHSCDVALLCPHRDFDCAVASASSSAINSALR